MYSTYNTIIHTICLKCSNVYVYKILYNRNLIISPISHYITDFPFHRICVNCICVQYMFWPYMCTVYVLTVYVYSICLTVYGCTVYVLTVYVYSICLTVYGCTVYVSPYMCTVYVSPYMCEKKLRKNWWIIKSH
jgi:hypothetical protein